MRLTAFVLAFVLGGCSGSPEGGRSMPEPAWSGPSTLLGTWVNPRLEGKALPAVLTFTAPNHFALTLNEVAISDGPTGPTYIPYEVIVTGTFRARGTRLTLTPVDYAGLRQFRTLAPRLFGLDDPGRPESYTFSVVAQELQLTCPDHTTLVFSRRRPRGTA